MATEQNFNVPASGIGRRSVIKAATWSAPVIVIAAAAPLAAASTSSGLLTGVQAVVQYFDSKAASFDVSWDWDGDFGSLPNDITDDMITFHFDDLEVKMDGYEMYFLEPDAFHVILTLRVDLTGFTGTGTVQVAFSGRAGVGPIIFA